MRELPCPPENRPRAGGSGDEHRAGSSSTRVPFPESASRLPGTALSSDRRPWRNRGAQLQRQSQTHRGRRGRTVVTMVQRTSVPGVPHIEPGFFPGRDLSSRGSRGSTYLLSLKPPLSLPLAVGAQKPPLYRALGKWGEARRIAPGSGGWTAGLISGWISPPTLWPCTLLGLQGPASCLDIDAQTP